MTTIAVKATRWTLGWDLQIDGGGATQARTLATAEQQVRDYLDTVEPDIDHENWTINVIPDIGSVIDEVRDARSASEDATRAMLEAAAGMRQVVRKLRGQGLSVTDTAVILGVSRGRVSQLAA